jgi:class 3 adenylate cyclase
MAEDATVIAIFVDVRGFTRWSEANEVFINLDRFISGFMDILRRRFREPEYQLKPLGDGALLISVLKNGPSERDLSKTVGRVLSLIRQSEADFKRHCAEFAKRVGHATDLRLGWGVVRGKALKMGADWTGHNLSKCSRLCNEARPFGVVVDRDDFPSLPKGTRGLVPQIRPLRGIGDVPVWVSAEIATQFVTREHLRETPEVHVAGTCFDEEGPGKLRLLFARRNEDRRLFPGKLEGCGGQLRYSETFVDGVRRHFRLELGLDVEVLADLHKFYDIREPNEPVIPGIRFLCRRVGTNEPTSSNHSELLWLTESEFHNTPAHEFVDNMKHEVIELVHAYKARK